MSEMQNNKHDKINDMNIITISTQCVDKKGDIGCFLTDANGDIISPTFPNMVKLIDYLDLNYKERSYLSIGRFTV